MNKLLCKSITIIVAVILCALCVGSAFCVYSVNATNVSVNISAVAPVADIYHLLGVDNVWDTANSNKMTLSAGTYTLNDVAIAAGDGVKVYNATTDSWYGYNTVVAGTSLVSGSGDSNITLLKAGQYDFSYVPASGLSISADNFTYTVNINHSGATGGNAVIKAWIWVDGSEGSWTDVTVVNDQQFTFTTTNTAINRCQLVRFNPATSEYSWSGDIWNQTPDLNISVVSTISTQFWS